MIVVVVLIEQAISEVEVDDEVKVKEGNIWFIINL